MALTLAFYIGASLPIGSSGKTIPGNIMPPAYSAGSVIERTPHALVYSAPGRAPLAKGPAKAAGTVLNVIRDQDRWIYQVRFAPHVTGWVFESDLQPAAARSRNEPAPRS